MSEKQQTLAKEIFFDGVGLHTGKDCKVTVRPGVAGGGFVLRVGGEETRIAPAIADGSLHRTVLKLGEAQVHTVEHLLGALHGSGADSAVVEVEGGEVPGLDGSAREFAEKIAEVGFTELEAEREVFAPRDAIAAGTGGASITAFPSRDGKFRVTYILDYPESRHARGTAELEITPQTVREALAPCRTFVMKCHADKLRAAGFGLGASTQNTVVLDGDTVVENELRFPDECVRHKILDIVGDLATVGCRLGAHVVAYKSGHALNLELAARLRREWQRSLHPKGLLDIRQVERVLPHRYPFLLVDRVLEMEPRRRILAYKNLTRNEEFFNGHFPGLPIMPGVLQIEALAQAGCVLMKGEESARDKLAVLMGIDEVKYRRPVVPGDRLMLEVVFAKLKGRIGVVNAKSSVDGEVATECTIKFALVDPEQYG